ncbi:MAG: hypothetical protein R6X22_13615 [Gemmatimonadota bacterium]
MTPETRHAHRTRKLREELAAISYMKPAQVAARWACSLSTVYESRLPWPWIGWRAGSASPPEDLLAFERVRKETGREVLLS